MLNGISDEVLDISPKCINFLEEHGNRMKDALIQLGALEEDKGAKDVENKNYVDDDMT